MDILNAAKERLILALNVPTIEQAKHLIDELNQYIVHIKIGHQLTFAGADKAFRGELIKRGKKLFIDLKFNDIDDTVSSTVNQLAKENITFCTVHGNSETIKAALEGRGDNEFPKILVVTVLTSLDVYDLKDLYNIDHTIRVEDLVLYRADRARQLGCDGVIASGHEAQLIKRCLGDDFIVVSPGIRLNGNGHDDHKRVSTPEDAIRSGADYIVVGRPILKATNPVYTTLEFLERIQIALRSSSKPNLTIT